MDKCWRLQMMGALKYFTIVGYGVDWRKEHSLGVYVKVQGVQHLPDVSPLRGNRGRVCGSRLGYNCSIAPMLWVGRGTRGSCGCIAPLLWLGRGTRVRCIVMLPML